MRLAPLVVVAAVALLGPAAAARADEPAADLAPGTQLMAVDDVVLQKAEIARGSKVDVVNVMKREGRVDGVKLALADGHVVKVALETIRNFFKVVAP